MSSSLIRKRERSSELGYSEYLKTVNRTARGRGIIGPKALVPRWVEEHVSRGSLILDYGAGPAMLHTLRLREVGFMVDAYDIGDNCTKDHLPILPVGEYDVVMASNVFNVQPTICDLRWTIRETYRALVPGGRLVANWPNSPRKVPLNKWGIIGLLHIEFRSVFWWKGNILLAYKGEEP